MSGTKAGALKTKATNLEKYGPDYYKKIGQMGGSISRPETRPFVIDKELAQRAGRIGGSKGKGK